MPGNSDVGQDSDFCVMKYEAKKDGGVMPRSVAAGFPWVKISPGSAIFACAQLGSGYELITNEMWQTIARNIETAQSAPGVYLNWSNASVSGDNALNRGHSDVPQQCS